MRINISLLIIALFISFSLFAQDKPLKDGWIFSYFKDNGQDGLHLAYSIDGFKWIALNSDSSVLHPTVGQDKLMRDPCIIKGADGLYHMVWTLSWKERAIGYAFSKDLVHWSEQRYIPLLENEPTALNCWAPEITYDRNTESYLLYWASTIPGKFTQTEVKGEKNHRIYGSWTKDFKSFSKPFVLYDKGFNVIDATILATRTHYLMFLKDETKYPKPEKNIRIASAQKIAGPYGPPSKPITGDFWAEGPTVTKIGEQWIVYFDRYTDHHYGAIASTDLVNWVDVSAALDMPVGIRHGSVLKVPQKVLLNLLKKR
jgi:beta-xylosidase